MTCRSDIPVWPVPRTYEDLHKEFLPKDRALALFVVTHKLYHHMQMLEARLGPHDPLVANIHDLLDIIERS